MSDHNPNDLGIGDVMAGLAMIAAVLFAALLLGAP